jgi:hypothetical protein
MIQHISAVTFAVSDMVRSIGFYRKLGFSSCLAATMRLSAVPPENLIQQSQHPERC